jgi:hypothetical protein
MRCRFANFFVILNRLPKPLIALLILGVMCASIGPVTALVKAEAQRRRLRLRVGEFEDAVARRLTPVFAEKGVSYPPKEQVWLAFKRERKLEVYCPDQAGRLVLVTTYPILGASGVLGPKLKEGDKQVPEGIYRIELLNPDSRFHLGIRLNYPNAFDRTQAQKEGRTDLGGDIMIHGGVSSVGCLAMGDPAAEDLFVLAYKSGIENVEVIISPTDFRGGGLRESSEGQPEWVQALYGQIEAELGRLK